MFIIHLENTSNKTQIEAERTMEKSSQLNMYQVKINEVLRFIFKRTLLYRNGKWVISLCLRELVITRSFACDDNNLRRVLPEGTWVKSLFSDFWLPKCIFQSSESHKFENVPQTKWAIHIWHKIQQIFWREIKQQGSIETWICVSQLLSWRTKVVTDTMLIQHFIDSGLEIEIFFNK